MTEIWLIRTVRPPGTPRSAFKATWTSPFPPLGSARPFAWPSGSPVAASPSPASSLPISAGPGKPQNLFLPSSASLSRPPPFFGRSTWELGGPDPPGGRGALPRVFPQGPGRPLVHPPPWRGEHGRCGQTATDLFRKPALGSAPGAHPWRRGACGLKLALNLEGDSWRRFHIPNTSITRLLFPQQEVLTVSDAAHLETWADWLSDESLK